MKQFTVIALLFLMAAMAEAGILNLVSLDSLATSRVSTDVLARANSCSFNEPLMTYDGWQYMAYYNSAASLCVGRRQLPGLTWDTLVVAGYTAEAYDEHYIPSMGLSPKDGTIHIGFDCHSSVLHYTVSAKGVLFNPGAFTWTGSLFDAVQTTTMPGLGSATYPLFVLRPDSVLQFIIRQGISGGGDWYLFEYNAAASSWANIGRFMAKEGSFTWPDNSISTSRSGYHNWYTYAGNRLHVSWCWREDISVAGCNNHDLMYAYSDNFGRTWKNNAGDSVAAIGTNPLQLTSPGIKVWTIGVNRGYINSVTQNMDNAGRFHVVTWHVRDTDPNNGSYAPANAWYFHYWRETNGVWHRDSICPIQTRCKILFDKRDNAFMLTDNAVLYGATAAAGWTDWQKIVDVKIGGGEATYDFRLWESSKIISVVSANMTVLDYAVNDSAWPYVLAEVRSSKDSSALANAFGGWSKGKTLIRGGKTNAQGNFLARIDTGTYDLAFRLIGYSRDTLKAVHILGGSADTVHARLYLDPLTPVRIRISPDSLMLNKQDSANLGCRVEYADGSVSDGKEAYTWTSLSPSVAQVSSTGRVHATNTAGTALIVSTLTSLGFSDTIPVHVVGLQTVSISPIGDAYVQDAEFSDTNYGSNPALVIWTTQWSYNRRAYIQFDTKAFAGKTILGATLKVNLAGSNISSVLNLPLYNVTSPWTESTITWSNSPARSTAIDTAVIYSQTDVFYTWDLTDWMKNHPTDTLLNLCIAEPVNDNFNANFHSREFADTARRPRLEILYADMGTALENCGAQANAGAPVFALLGNPFNPVCHMRVSLIKASDISLEVLDLSGRHIRTIAQGRYPAGIRGFTWHGDTQKGGAAASGVYVMRIRINGKIEQIKAVLVK